MDLVYQIYGVWLYPNDPLFMDDCVFDPSDQNQYYQKNQTILVKDFLKLKVCDEPTGYNPNYRVYDLFWNETKSGINLLDWKYVWVFPESSPDQKSILRINEYQEQRIQSIRDLKLKELGI